MAIHLSGKLEIESNIDNMITELRNFLQIVTGKKIDKIDAVAFSLYYTLSKVTPTDIDNVDFDDINLVTDAVNKFKLRIKPLILETIDEVLQEV